jgi:RimJ/RimL family protein N-acetyltransferase
MIKIDYSKVSAIAKLASKDRVSVNETKKTQWFTIEGTYTTFPICAVMEVAHGYRIKAVWIPPTLRGQGIGTKMTIGLIDYVENELFASRVEVFAYNPNFYESNGFKRYGSLPNGAIKLERFL